MMNGKILLRAGMLLVLVAAFCVALIGPDKPEAQAGELYLGIPVLSVEEEASLGSYRYQDYSEDLKFQCEHVAVDKEHSVIYLSQNIDGTTRGRDLKGALTIALPGRELAFAPDDRWEDLSSAVREGYTFRLLIRDYKNTYMEYDVVFTTLPVLYAYGNYTYINEDHRNVMSGKMVLWDPELLDDAGTGIHTAYLQWHVRGKTSSKEPKRPWKLSLKNSEGKNKDEDLLGLGSDDDWILNPMNMEDSNVREKLFMDLWNVLAAETDHNYPMSRGEYVEVVINGEYCGLYLLQRRIDEKYLALGENTALVKGNQELRCEIVSDNIGAGVPGGLVEKYFLDGNYEDLNRESFVDTSLFLQLFSAKDNEEYKNMYYLFEKTQSGQQVYLIPWDTDMSLGIIWNPAGGFLYDTYQSVISMASRMEAPFMLEQDPQLQEIMADRWFELREDLFTRERVYSMIEGYLQQLDASGAVARDQETWGLFYGGQDTLEGLYQYIDYRLQIVDYAFTN